MLPNDPAMLLSYINMKLRDQYDSLEKLKTIDYIYDNEKNQFK